jgi:hypothetical protein
VALLLRMDAQIQALTERVARQEERIGQLERRLGRSTRNCPSHPARICRAARRGATRICARREQGGQAGHAGRAVRCCRRGRSECCGCGHHFGEHEVVADGGPARHQVEELPPITVAVSGTAASGCADRTADGAAADSYPLMGDEPAPESRRRRVGWTTSQIRRFLAAAAVRKQRKSRSHSIRRRRECHVL